MRSPGKADTPPFVAFAWTLRTRQQPVLYIGRGQPQPRVPHQLAPPRAAANKFASISTEVYANETPAPGGTNASLSDARGTTPTPSVPSSAPLPVRTNSRTADPTYTLKTTVNTSILAKEISKYPNQQLATYIVNGFNNGFAIGYQDPPINNSPPNLSSALQHPEAVTNYLARECQAGHTAGPFATPPFHRMHISPLGVVPKKECGKWRLIMHLSHPTGHSVNDGIPIQDYSLKYISVDTAMDAAMALGRGAVMAKVDIRAAFRLCPVRPEDWPYLGMQWNGQYYFDKVLPFGLRSAPYIFNCLANALTWILHNKYSVDHVYHYLNDFITLGAPSTTQCSQNLHHIRDLFLKLIADEKLEGPATSIVFLGILLDTVALEARLPTEKLYAIKAELCQWLSRTSCTKRELLSLIGLLSFAAKVVPPGRTFLRRMIDTSTAVSQLDKRITLTEGFVKDLRWWHQFVSHWNGRSFFKHPKWIPSTTLNLFTDSSGTIGYGAYFDGRWFQGRWSEDQTTRSIQWKELFPIIMAAATWGHLWAGKRITFLCDNEAVTSAIATGTSTCPHIMELLRQLFLCAAKHDFSATAKHIPGNRNVIADALSRFNMQVFRHAAPEAEQQPSHQIQPPSIDI